MSDKFSLEKEFQRRARVEAIILDALQAINGELAAIRALVEGGSAVQPVPPVPTALGGSKPTSDRDYWPGKDIGLTRELSQIVYRDRQSSNAESSGPEADKAESSETDASAAMFLKSNLDVTK
jgi:hypothetical protein